MTSAGKNCQVSIAASWMVPAHHAILVATKSHWPSRGALAATTVRISNQVSHHPMFTSDIWAIHAKEPLPTLVTSEQHHLRIPLVTKSRMSMETNVVQSLSIVLLDFWVVWREMAGFVTSDYEVVNVAVHRGPHIHLRGNTLAWYEDRRYSSSHRSGSFWSHIDRYRVKWS